MRKIVHYIFIVLPFLAASQRIINVDKSDISPVKGHFYTVAGTPVSMAKYVRVVEGSPFFSETWMRGSVFFLEGGRFDNLLLRLDLVSGEIHFIGTENNELVAKNPVAEILFTDSLTGDEYRFVHSSAFIIKPRDEGWYLFLCEGPAASLYKKIEKSISETRPYGSATYEQTIRTTATYYVFANSSFSQTKKIQQLPDILYDKRIELQKFISARKLSGKKDEDFIMLIEYYNSLPENDK